MALKQEFIPLALDELHREAAVLKTEGWRFIQTHAVNAEDGIDLYYSFMKDGLVANYRVEGVKKDQPVPSITDLFLAAFVFENEARELFGVDMRDIAIDFAGAMYAPAVDEPMTFISPEQKAAREKAMKAAAAKAAKAESAGGDAKTSKGGFVMTPERQARLDAKLATMSPDKAEKVKAALAARAAEAGAAGGASGAAQAAPAAGNAADVPETAVAGETAASKDAQLEETLANLDPDKAAKVRAALEGKAAAQAAETAESAQGELEGGEDGAVDEQVSALVGLMDEAKAAVVLKALNMKGGE